MRMRMSDSVSPSNGGDPQKTGPGGRSGRERAEPLLRLAVVAYDDSSDRATIYPPNQTGMGQLERWLSVDVSVVVDVSAWR